MRARALQSQPVRQHKSSTLGSDAFLLDIVPPSPCYASDIKHARSQSEHHGIFTDHDIVVRLPGIVRDRTADPTFSACWPMKRQSPPPHSPSTPNSLSSGVTNAAFIHSVSDRAETATSGHVAGIRRSSSGHHVPQSPSVFTSNGVDRIRADDGRRSTTAGGRSKPCEDEYVHSHHLALPPHSVSAASVTGHHNSAVFSDRTVSHPVGLRGPLSLSTGELNFSPPAPHLTSNQVHQLSLCLTVHQSCSDVFD